MCLFKKRKQIVETPEKKAKNEAKRIYEYLNSMPSAYVYMDSKEDGICRFLRNYEHNVYYALQFPCSLTGNHFEEKSYSSCFFLAKYGDDDYSIFGFSGTLEDFQKKYRLVDYEVGEKIWNDTEKYLYEKEVKTFDAFDTSGVWYEDRGHNDIFVYKIIRKLKNDKNLEFTVKVQNIRTLEVHIDTINWCLFTTLSHEQPFTTDVEYIADF